MTPYEPEESANDGPYKRELVMSIEVSKNVPFSKRQESSKQIEEEDDESISRDLDRE